MVGRTALETETFGVSAEDRVAVLRGTLEKLVDELDRLVLATGRGDELDRDRLWRSLELAYAALDQVPPVD